MNPRLWGCIVLLLVRTACGGDENCKNACDKLSSCNLKSSGLSCDADCTQGNCAACVSDTACADIQSGACSSDCPGVSFTKK